MRIGEILNEKGARPSFVKKFMRELKNVGEKGLSARYKSVHDFMFDVYSSLPKGEVLSVVDSALKSPNIDSIAKQWKENLNFDLKQELKYALEDAKT